jgi:hypothetical protein
VVLLNGVYLLEMSINQSNDSSQVGTFATLEIRNGDVYAGGSRYYQSNENTRCN